MMSKLSRLLHFSGQQHDEESEPAAASTSESSSAVRMDMFAPYSMHGRERKETLQQPENPTPESGETKAYEVTADSEQGEVRQAEKNYAEFGEKVAAVLASAEVAADQIRQSARDEAERLQAKASEKVAGIRRENAKLRADADTYSKETRAAADRYQAETRTKIEKEVADRRAKLNEQVRGIELAAGQKARDIEADARRRHKTMIEEVGRTDARLQQLLGVFRGMTAQLEGLVSTEPAGQPDGAKGDATDGKALDEALKPLRTPKSTSRVP